MRLFLSLFLSVSSKTRKINLVLDEPHKANKMRVMATVKEQFFYLNYSTVRKLILPFSQLQIHTDCICPARTVFLQIMGGTSSAFPPEQRVLCRKFYSKFTVTSLNFLPHAGGVNWTN